MYMLQAVVMLCFIFDEESFSKMFLSVGCSSLVSCMSLLRESLYVGGVGLSYGDVDSCRDDPQYNVMKYLVFGTISSSLLSELQIIIPRTDRNGVYIDMVNPTL